MSRECILRRLRAFKESMMVKCFRLSIFLLSVWTGQAWGQWGTITSVEVAPAVITDRSVVSITVKGEEGAPCYLISHRFTVQGHKIVVDATLTPNPLAMCITLVVPYQFTQMIGSLEPGEYDVEVRLNETLAMAAASISVKPYSQVLTLSPPTGTYTAVQDFDFALILEHQAQVESGVAYLAHANTGSAQWVDVSAGLAQCLKRGLLDIKGTSYRCPAISDLLVAGTYTLIVTLRLSDGNEVTDTVTWTVLGAAEL
jgi:hypothetical protein